VIAENADQLLDIGQMRHVFERQRIVGEQRSDHQGKRCVLRARDRDGSGQLVAADNSDAIHWPSFLRAIPVLARNFLAARLDHRAFRFKKAGFCGHWRQAPAVAGQAFSGFSVSPSAAARPSGLVSASPVRRERACALRFIRLARNSAASRAWRWSAPLEGIFGFDDMWWSPLVDRS
jgi:hypothetical protein